MENSISQLEESVHSLNESEIQSLQEEHVLNSTGYCYANLNSTAYQTHENEPSIIVINASYYDQKTYLAVEISAGAPNRQVPTYENVIEAGKFIHSCEICFQNLINLRTLVCGLSTIFFFFCYYAENSGIIKVGGQ